MNMLPQISIVTPSFNQAPYLRKTIESVLNQQVDLEYIIVDGCSTDGSIEILKEYKNDAKIIVEKDSGQSDAIAKGFLMAKGDLFAWLNSDDIYLPGALEKVVEEFHNGQEFIYGHSCIIDANGSILRKRVAIPVGFKELYYGMYTIPQESSFFSKQLYFQSGGINKYYDYAMDYDLWLRMACIKKPKRVDYFLSGFRFHEKQKSRNISLYNEERRKARETLITGPLDSSLLRFWYKYLLKIRILSANVMENGIHCTIRDGIKKKIGMLP